MVQILSRIVVKLPSTEVRNGYSPPIAFWEKTDHGAFSYRVGKPKCASVDSPVYGIAVTKELGKKGPAESTKIVRLSGR